jgi:hypothetical protein
MLDDITEKIVVINDSGQSDIVECLSYTSEEERFELEEKASETTPDLHEKSSLLYKIKRYLLRHVEFLMKFSIFILAILPPMVETSTISRLQDGEERSALLEMRL